jgi:hypothetical protein
VSTYERGGLVERSQQAGQAILELLGLHGRSLPRPIA